MTARQPGQHTGHRSSVGAVIESAVMGRAAVLNTSAWLGLAGLVQLLGFPSSRAVTQAGGRTFDVVWALSLIGSCAFVVAAHLVTRPSRPRSAAYGNVLEIGGIALMVLGLGTYLLLVLTMPPRTGQPPPTHLPSWATLLEGRVVLFALLAAALTNVGGRTLLLLRQSRLVVAARRAAR